MSRQDNNAIKELNKCIIYSLGKKRVVWLSQFNKYMLVEPIIAEIIKAILNGQQNESIENDGVLKTEFDKKRLKLLIPEVRKTLGVLLESAPIEEQQKSGCLHEFISKEKAIRKYYRINNLAFFIEYETSGIAEICHPKFAHLEMLPTKQYQHHLKVFHQNETLSLQVDGYNRGTWNEKDEHFLNGKFSMEILQKLYEKEEEEWLGVYHAAGISNGKKCILFLGDSGSGKSTLSALLMASGFDVLSDDFLPLEKSQKHVCRFPAAISVKKSALPVLVNKFPGLDESKEYTNVLANKTFRYLPPEKTKLESVPCVALVFVKYVPESGIQIENLPKDIAFQKLIPDSWISPLEDNVCKFLQWFDSLQCWRMNYSDNDAMVKKIQELFNDEC